MIESNSLSIVFSNQLHHLADELVARLFDSSTRPFEKRYVLVPSEFMREFLLNYIANHPRLQIAAGINILPLQQGIVEWLSIVSPGQKRHLPSHLELALAIEDKIYELLERGELSRLKEYLELESEGLTEKLRRRVAALSDPLAQAFGQYGLYGDEFLQQWLTEEGWQQTLWREIFSVHGPRTYPWEVLRGVSNPNHMQPYCAQSKIGNFGDKILSPGNRLERDAISRAASEREGDCQGSKDVEKNSHDWAGRSIHLFGFNFLPQLYLSFFARMGGVFYQLSPCALFWEDVWSERERVFYERKLRQRGVREKIQEEMSGYLKTSHPLLGNWGKLGREMLLQLDPFDLDITESYVAPSKATLLGTIQGDLLELQVSEGHAALDDSIQVHNAPSRHREVEVLRDALQTLLMRHAQDPEPIELHDILVLAPDIQVYAPFIRKVFEHPEVQLPFSIHGIEQQALSDFAQALSHFLTLKERPLELDGVLKLFSFPAFRKRWNWTSEEVYLIEAWLKKANVRTGEASWQEGIDRLLLGLAVRPQEGLALELWPVLCIATSELDLFNRFLLCHAALKADLADLQSSEIRTLQEWFALLSLMVARHFAIENENEPLLQELQKLARLTHDLESPTWGFSSVERIVVALLERRSAALTSAQLQKIAFGSLASGNIRPARIVWLLGVDETNFPRNQTPLALSALAEKSTIYLPRRADEDRYLFLELLLCAQSYFQISYPRIDPKDNKAQEPSYLVEELFAYMTRLSGTTPQVLKHPKESFDALYFASDASVKSWQKEAFLLAQAQRLPQVALTPFFASTQTSQHVLQQIVDLRALQKLAKNPIRFYFNEALKIYLKETEDTEEETFVLTALQQYFLKKEALKSSFDQIWAKTEGLGELPHGMLGKVAARNLQSEIEKVKETLEHFKLSGSDIMTVELSFFCEAPHQTKLGGWVVPALKVVSEGSEDLYLTGKLEEVSTQGLLLSAEKSTEALLAAWPQILVYLHLSQHLPQLPPRVLFLKDQASLDLDIKDPQKHLREYLNYYNLALQSPSPLMPKWGQALLFKGEQEFVSKAMEDGMFPDMYLSWLKRRGGGWNPSELYHQWSGPLRERFAWIFDLVQKERSHAPV